MVKKSVVFMFSGQGSQYYHMGKPLFEQNELFREWMLKQDDIVCGYTGYSVINSMYDSNKRKSDRFDLLKYTHPAIFMIQYALAQVLMETGIRPEYSIGTSLGEFVSAAVSNVIDVKDALYLLLKQAETFERCCSSDGTMLTILHSPNIFDETPLIRDNSEIVSINYDTHFVIAGKSEHLKTIETYLLSKDISSQMLPVQYAFHSSLIESAKVSFCEIMKNIVFGKPSINFASCLLGSITTSLPENYFWNVARNPILFREAFDDVRRNGGNVYIDMGPVGTLSSFARQNVPPESGIECLNIISPFGQDVKNLEKVKNYFL